MFRKFNALVIPTATVAAMLLLGTVVIPATAATSGPKILPPAVNKQIGVKWWKWAFSFPRDESPLTDATGERCDKGLQGNNFFLAGVAGPIADPAHTERTCSTPIDHNKKISFPVLNAACLLGDVCEHPGEPVTDIKELKRQVSEQVDAVGTVQAEIDGKSIDLKNARVQSPLFKTSVAKDTPFDQPPDFPIPARQQSDSVCRRLLGNCTTFFAKRRTTQHTLQRNCTSGWWVSGLCSRRNISYNHQISPQKLPH